MAYPAYVREKARRLRADKKLTIDELAERLALPRTTIYRWVRDLPIGKTEKETLAAFRAGQASKEIHRRRRAAAYGRGKAELSTLLAQPTFRDFVCMYIGEGSKRNRNTVAICNSDPAVIKLGAHWIRRLSSNPVGYSFQHHADQNPVEVCDFWGDLLDVEPSRSNSSASRTAGVSQGVDGARDMASCRSAPPTPICAPVSTHG